TDYCVPMLKPRCAYRLYGPEEGDTPVPASEKGGTPVPEGDTPVPLRRYAGTAPTPVHPPNPNNHHLPVVTPKGGRPGADDDDDGAPRLPIEAEAWNAIHTSEAVNA